MPGGQIFFIFRYFEAEFDAESEYHREIPLWNGYTPEIAIFAIRIARDLNREIREFTKT